NVRTIRQGLRGSASWAPANMRPGAACLARVHGTHAAGQHRNGAARAVRDGAPSGIPTQSMTTLVVVTDQRTNPEPDMGDEPASQRKPTIRTVAQRAGVSLKTVSRVINNEPSVLPATRARVLQAIAELDYEPDPSARNLRSSSAYVIG